MSKHRAIPHSFENESLESVFVGRRDGEARPTVVLIPTVMGVTDLEIGFGRQAGRVEEAVEADRGGERFSGAGEVERALPAETIAGDYDLVFRHLAQVRGSLQHMLQPAAQRRAIASQPSHLPEHRVARGAVEFLAE